MIYNDRPDIITNPNREEVSKKFISLCWLMYGNLTKCFPRSHIQLKVCVSPTQTNKTNKQTNNGQTISFLQEITAWIIKEHNVPTCFFLSGFPDEERPVRLNPYLAWTLTDRLDRLRLGVQLGHWTGHHSWNCLDIHKEDERKCRYQGCAPRPVPPHGKKGCPAPQKLAKPAGRGKADLKPLISKSTTPSLSLPW